MKKLLLCLSLTLAGCATRSVDFPSAEATVKIGTVVEKQTLVNQVSRGYQSPIDVGVGVGGGSGGNIGWGVSLGLGQLLGLLGSQTTTETVFQYKIKISNAESITMQSVQNFEVGSCLTVWEHAGDANYPKIAANPACQK